MEQEHKNLKPLLLAATAAVTVIAILLVFFFSGRKSKSTQTIILPDPPAQEQAPDEEQPEASVAELTRENVQSVLKKSVARPSSYHQSMQIVITSGDIQRTQTAELWVRGELVKAQITTKRPCRWRAAPGCAQTTLREFRPTRVFRITANRKSNRPHS